MTWRSRSSFVPQVSRNASGPAGSVVVGVGVGPSPPPPPAATAAPTPPSTATPMRIGTVLDPFFFGSDEPASAARGAGEAVAAPGDARLDRKSTRLNSRHLVISYAVSY